VSVGVLKHGPPVDENVYEVTAAFRLPHDLRPGRYQVWACSPGCRQGSGDLVFGEVRIAGAPSPTEGTQAPPIAPAAEPPPEGTIAALLAIAFGFAIITLAAWLMRHRRRRAATVG
jgi:hypothetical protein